MAVRYKGLWIGLAAVVVGSFAILGYFGVDMYRKAPPIPTRVVTTEGVEVFAGQDIRDGQNVWQSMGGQQVGSIWGHGAYVAPDWSADWLHREAVWLLDLWAQREHGAKYDELSEERQGALKARLKRELRTNTYNAESGEIVISADRAAAFEAVSKHYASLFGEDPEYGQLRESYAIPANSIKTPERQRLMNAFFFWAAWSCGTNRPGSEVTYTNNWPHEPLIDNRPSSSIVLW
jgi:nitric oxide reductase subunit B